MFMAKMRTRDLTIQRTGNSRQEVINKINDELNWFNNNFPNKGYAKKVGKRSKIVWQTIVWQTIED